CYQPRSRPPVAAVACGRSGKANSSSCACGAIRPSRGGRSSFLLHRDCALLGVAQGTARA
ncbi:hypothetical protein Tco_0587350, partial [Tanacetum coccineum]